ncbi:hypothetical protein GRJ2_002228000 [Grus japonensis]|uniref:Uncharacterized protein n=1 Tax=Grus japonensis TaxID=30415 RepID=A0ABC9XJG3_GRUJA
MPRDRCWIIHVRLSCWDANGESECCNLSSSFAPYLAKLSSIPSCDTWIITVNSWTYRHRVYPYNGVLANRGMMLSTLSKFPRASVIPDFGSNEEQECEAAITAIVEMIAGKDPLAFGADCYCKKTEVPTVSLYMLRF